MKHTIIIILLLNYLFASGQDNGGKHLFQTNSKTHLYYVDLSNTDGKVYTMGGYLDKAGEGYSLRSTDTLFRQTDGTYTGNNIQIATESNKLYLVTESKKTKKFLLETVESLNAANHNLNNAYYLDHYFKMSDELNKMYPLNHHSFRNGFYAWEALPNKDIDYLQFRDFANKRLKEIQDSISKIQDSYVALSNYIIQNIKTLHYDVLRDSLTKLPAEYKSLSWYYGTVINEVARQRPEYFFKLAEDFPANRHLIFFAPENNKDVIAGLRAVEGHDEIKKAFFKGKK